MERGGDRCGEREGGGRGCSEGSLPMFKDGQYSLLLNLQYNALVKNVI